MHLFANPFISDAVSQRILQCMYTSHMVEPLLLLLVGDIFLPRINDLTSFPASLTSAVFSSIWPSFS